MKIETEEIFVLTKTKAAARQPWRDKLQKAEQASVDQKEQLDKKSKRNEPRKQRFNHSNTRSITQRMQKNWSFHLKRKLT